MSSLFLSDAEREAVRTAGHKPPLNQFYWALLGRAQELAGSPGLTRPGRGEWWHQAADGVTDVAMAHALKPADDIGAWLRDATLSIVRRPADEWVGPWFRDHELAPPVGNLETAHLCLAVAAALDLAPGVFSEAERDEAATVLREQGAPMCLRWLDRANHLNNWRCILAMGLAVAAAYLDDGPLMQRAAEEFDLCKQAFQPDGSYGESLQYGNYAAWGLMLIYEALVRRRPALANNLSLEPYARYPRWAAYSMFYNKPLSGWGQYPRARAANFNDSAAAFRPGGDLLLHWAARAKATHPVEAGLARWLFDTYYLPVSDQGSFGRASFGMVNDFGFLTLPLLPQAAAPLSPEEAGLPAVAAFSNGDTIARDAWRGRTVLAVHGGGDPLHAPGHLHGDLNSFILVHNRERLLVDPGHACYRNLMRVLDISTAAHNTCTFTLEPEGEQTRHEDTGPRLLEQSSLARRALKGGRLGPPADRGGRRLLTAQEGPVVAIASEAARLYGAPIERSARFWLLLGAHVLFVVDHIESSLPVRTTWNWLLNNRDQGLQVKYFKPDRLVARRGNAGMKLFHLGGGAMSGPVYAYVHDAYNILPMEPTEARAGSGLLMRWQERQARTSRTVVHAIAVDDYGTIAGWHLRLDGGRIGLEAPGGSALWTLEIEEDPLALSIGEVVGGTCFRVAQDTRGDWRLSAV